MGDIIAGLTLLAAGLFVLIIWWKSRRNPRFYGAMVESFAIAASKPFARGMAGADVLLASGGIFGAAFGMLQSRSMFHTGLSRWVGGILLALTVMSFILAFVVAWLGRPTFLFPPHARDQIAPWREALQARRDRKARTSRADEAGLTSQAQSGLLEQGRIQHPTIPDADGLTSAAAGAGTGTLVVTRPKGVWQDLARAYRIEVDAEHRGDLRRGQTIELPVSVGRHVVRARIDWTGSPPLEVTVPVGASVTCLVSTGYGLPQARPDEDTYLSLTIVPEP